MDDHTFGTSPAARALVRALYNATPRQQLLATRSAAKFNKMMIGLRDIKDPALHKRILQMIPAHPTTGHPTIVYTLLSNLRVARKRVEIARREKLCNSH